MLMENFGHLGKNKLYRTTSYDIFSQSTGQGVILSYDKIEIPVLYHFFYDRIKTVA